MHDLDAYGRTRDNRCGYCDAALGTMHSESCSNPYVVVRRVPISEVPMREQTTHVECRACWGDGNDHTCRGRVRPWDPGKPDDLRATGWMVAVHNDYRQTLSTGLKLSMTFWLVVKGSTALKGEGVSDEEALGQIRQQARMLGLYQDPRVSLYDRWRQEPRAAQ